MLDITGLGGDTACMSSLGEKLCGKFVVFDGPDGAGKSTQLEMLREYLSQAGCGVTLAIDPGGTDTGGRIREILLHSKGLDISPVCETFLFMASRAQLAHEVIRPAIQAGRAVLGDRFISATLAYQGALGVDPKFILDLAGAAVGQTWPDLTVILDIDADRGLARLDSEPDRMESRAGSYHEQVRQKFRQLHEIYPRPVRCLDATGTPREVFDRLLQLLETEFDNA